jgi:NitT/TauT family transport system substrate-binding protein
VSFANKGVTAPADLRGKKVGNWGFGNEFELFAGMTKAGIAPSDVTLVQQQFDMQALLNGEIDAAQAMSYNEYAQVLEATNPATGQLYQPSDFTIINWNDAGTAMLQDAIWANTEKLSRPGLPGHDVEVHRRVAQGLGVLPRQPRVVPRHRGEGRLEAGRQPPAVAGQRDQQADLAVARGRGRHDRPGGVGPDGAGRAAGEERRRATVLTKEPGRRGVHQRVRHQGAGDPQGEGVDVVGSGFTPETVTLNAGGA